jgi:hypothetical protein
MTGRYTAAQIYALVFGATLLLVGLAGFAADESFDTGAKVSGDELIVFEVNGWHNVVHIASGLVGLALWRNPVTARSFALGFGLVYGLVTLIGFVDGNDVIGLLPVNAADNVLHLAIAAVGILAGLASAPRASRTARPV